MLVHIFLACVFRNVAFGGNFLLNVGPSADGTIPAIFQDRLLEIGNWLSINADAIFGTVPWRVQNQTQMTFNINGYYTSKGNVLNYIMQGWPANNLVVLNDPVPDNGASVKLLGYPKEIKWEVRTSPKQVVIQLPPLTVNEVSGKYAWTLQLRQFK